MARGLFVTGTGTNVGKTYVGVQIVTALRQRGLRVGVYKPVASGCQVDDHGGLHSEDAWQLWQAAGEPLSFGHVCPQRFAAATAPHVAARLAGSRVDSNLLRIGIDPWLDACDFVLVEGAGGLMSPLSDDDYNATLAEELGFPLLVVAANRLGVINDTLQTVITATVWGEGLPIAGVVLNDVAPPMGADTDESCESNAAELRAHLGVPLLAEVPWLGALSETAWLDGLVG